ncbi:MAG: squalene/phytoene synthase family protein [Pseudomonadota bacterium]
MQSQDETYALDAVRARNQERALAFAFAPAARRRALFAVAAFDTELEKTAETVSEPMLGQIRLAWWREAVGEVYGDGVPRKHPLVLALASTISRWPDIRTFVENTLDAVEPFLEPGDDSDLDQALATRMALYTAVAGALGVLEGRSDAHGAPLALHALAKIAPDPNAAATAGGPEPIARRFARALAAHPPMAGELSRRIRAFRQVGSNNPPLASAPLSLVRLHKNEVQVVRHPFFQRLLIFKTVLSGSI